MATVDATVGGAAANSYVTVAVADAYLDARLNASAWTGASAADQARAVIEATRTLDTFHWKGTRVNGTQALSWPRAYVPNPDAPKDVEVPSLVTDIAYYPEASIPQRILDATCELALEFLKAGTTDLAALDADAQLTSKTTGPLSKSWAPGGKPQGVSRFTRVLDLITPLREAARREVRRS